MFICEDLTASSTVNVVTYTRQTETV